MSTDILTISENFSSLQGEGQTVGVPSVFLRLTGCQLNCIYCDTTEVWKKGKHFTIEEVYFLFQQQGYLKSLDKGAHLILTGGDPLMQQEALLLFLYRCRERGHRWCVEVESEGVIMPFSAMFRYVTYWNISPKLENSGMPLSERIKVKVLKQHVLRGINSQTGPPFFAPSNTIFKFPVGRESDIKEVLAIRDLCGIKDEMIYLMPLCNNRRSFELKGPEVAKWAIANGWRFSPRLHLTLYDQATGV
jgi:7-carboxy-7-deazaguanine synthase